MSNFILNFPSNKIFDDTTSEILKKNQSLVFHRQLENYKSTELHNLSGLASKLKLSSIHVKDESTRFGLGSFKPLGVSYALSRILKNNNSKSSLCTATDGNHGIGLSWISQIFNKKCIVYVPKHTPKLIVEKISKLGAEVSQLQKNYDETCKYAFDMSKKMGWQLVQDVCWEGYEKIPAYIMSGYQTHFREIDEKVQNLGLPFFDVVFLQCGVGSWAASCIWYYLNKYGQRRPKIILVEPLESAGVFESFQYKKRSTPSGSLKTIANSLNCGIPSMSAWKIIRSGCDAVITINDDDIIKSIGVFSDPVNRDPKINSGESGAVGLAGLLNCLSGKSFSKLKKHIGLDCNSRVLLFNTEGNSKDVNY